MRRLAWFAGGALTLSMLLGPAIGSALAASVTPTPHQDNITSCPAGYLTITLTPPADSGTVEGVTVDVTYNADDTLDFDATGGLVYIAYVKGGDNYNEYDYRPGGVASDSDLVSPLNNGGQVPAVSHSVFCVKETTTTSTTTSTTDTTSSTSTTTSTTDTTSSTSTTTSTTSTTTTTSGEENPAVGTPPGAAATLPSTSTSEPSDGGPSGGALALVLILLGAGAAGLVILSPAATRTKK